MDEIFAPWRVEWIRREEENPDVESCVFCELPEQDMDRENLIVAATDHSVVMFNNAPYNPGHLMVIPRPHGGSLDDLSDAVLLDHAKLKARAIKALEAALEPDGFNVGLNLGGDAAGGSIDDHVHTHVVPRFDGDTNFMPVVSETKVIVEAVGETYDLVHEAFTEQPGTSVSDVDSAVWIDL